MREPREEPASDSDRKGQERELRHTLLFRVSSAFGLQPLAVPRFSDTRLFICTMNTLLRCFKQHLQRYTRRLISIVI